MTAVPEPGVPDRLSRLDRFGELWLLTGGFLPIALPGASTAGVWTALLGGYHCHTADRRVADRLLAADPGMGCWARVHAAFRDRVVATMLRELGVRQFVDLGCGLPDGFSTLDILTTAANTRHAPAASGDRDGIRLLCLDHDPVVIGCLNQVLTPARPGLRCEARQVDLRDAEQIVAEATTSLIDFAEPVAVIAAAVLHHLDDGQAHNLLATLRSMVTTGSYLAVSHPSTPQPMTPRLAAAITDCQTATGAWHLRPSTRAAELLGPGWAPVPPGIAPIARWWAYPDHTALRTATGWGVLALAAPATGTVGPAS